MSFLQRLFGSSSTGRSSKDVDAQLQRLETEAEKALPGYVGSAYNRAGDIALREGRAEKAVGYYGRAIDAFLEDAQREAARGVANKILRVRPDTLRTLCTLTWLDLAAKHEATALLHLRDYVEKAAERDEHARAATQIYQMARICPLEEFVGAVADSLDRLNYPNRAGEVRGWVADGPPDMIADSDDLADACLQAAIQSNERVEDLLDDELDAAEQESDPDDAEVAAAEADAVEDEDGSPPEEADDDLRDPEPPADEVEDDDSEADRDDAEGEPEEAEDDDSGDAGSEHAAAQDDDFGDAEDDAEGEPDEPEDEHAADDGDDGEAAAKTSGPGSRKSRKKRKKKKGKGRRKG